MLVRSLLAVFLAAFASSGLAQYAHQQLDTSFVPKVYNSGEVQIVAKLQDGKCLVGGRFDWINGQPADWLARLNADGSVDASFNPQKPFDFERFVAAVPVSDGKVLLGYTFALRLYALAKTPGATEVKASVKPTPGPEPVPDPVPFYPWGAKVVRLNADGSVDTSFQEVILNTTDGDLDSALHAVVPLANGKVLIGGGFVAASGVAAKGLVRVNSDGSVDTSFKTVVSGGAVLDAMRCADGCVMIAGQFNKINKTKLAFGLARLKPNGEADGKFVPRVKGKSLATVVDISPGMGNSFLAAFADAGLTKTTLRTVGMSGEAGAVLAESVAGIPVGVSLLGGGQVFMICAPSLNALYASANKVMAPAVMVFADANGKRRAQVMPLGYRPNGFYRSGGETVAFGSSGMGLYATPNLRGFQFITRPGIMRLSTFDPNAVPWVAKSASVGKVALVPGSSKVLAAGSFSIGMTAGNQMVERQGLARLLADGSVDEAFAPTQVYASQLLANADGGATLIGTIQPGPAVDVVAGPSVQKLARLTATGEEDATFTQTAEPLATVLARQPDGRLLVGRSAGSLLRYSADGVQELEFAPLFGYDSPSAGAFGVAAIADVLAESNGGIIVTGSFNRVNTLPRAGVVRLLANGNVDEATFTTVLPRGFTKILPRGDGYLAVAPSLNYSLEPIIVIDPPVVVPPPNTVPAAASVASSMVVIAPPIFFDPNGTTRSPFLGLTSTGAEDKTFTVPDLKANGAWSWMGNTYGVTKIVPTPFGSWIAMTRGLKDTKTDKDVSLVHISANGRLDRMFPEPSLGAAPDQFGGGFYWWWGPRLPADFVQDMAFDGSGLYLGGSFWSIDSEARNGLGRLQTIFAVE